MNHTITESESNFGSARCENKSTNCIATWSTNRLIEGTVRHNLYPARNNGQQLTMRACSLLAGLLLLRRGRPSRLMRRAVGKIYVLPHARELSSMNSTSSKKNKSGEQSIPYAVAVPIAVGGCAVLCAAGVMIRRKRIDRLNQISFELNSSIAFERINSAFSIGGLELDILEDDLDAPPPLVLGGISDSNNPILPGDHSSSCKSHHDNHEDKAAPQ